MRSILSFRKRTSAPDPIYGSTFCFLICLFLLACSSEQPKKKPLPNKGQVRDLSVEMHSWDRQRQEDEINKYAERNGWDMKATASGLRYMELQSGTGPLAMPGQIAKVDYTVKLMDGRICYSSANDGSREFLIGEDNVEEGIHEGIQLMRKGSVMRFILPSHLAHGLTGDGKKIPPVASLVVEIKLLDIQ